MNHLKKSIIPIKSIERVNKKIKKNGADNNDNTKSSTNDIIVWRTLCMDNNDEVAVSSECALSSNDVEQSSAGNISTNNNNINQQSQFVTDNTKIYKDVTALNIKIVDEMENNNNVINDKVKGRLNVCIDVHSDNNVCN